MVSSYNWVEFGPIALKTVTPLFGEIVEGNLNGEMTVGQQETVRRLEAHRAARQSTSPFSQSAELVIAEPAAETVEEPVSKPARRHRQAAIVETDMDTRLDIMGSVNEVNPELVGMAGDYAQYAGLLALLHSPDPELTPAQARTAERSLSFMPADHVARVQYTLDQYNHDAQQPGASNRAMRNKRYWTRVANTEFAMIASVIDSPAPDYEGLKRVFTLSRSVLYLAGYVGVEPGEQSLAEIRADVSERLAELVKYDSFRPSWLRTITARYGLETGQPQTVDQVMADTGIDRSSVNKQERQAMVHLRTGAGAAALRSRGNARDTKSR